MFLNILVLKSSLSCLAHVVNLRNVDVMGRITKTAIVENATAIWEYDPTIPDNRVLGGSLDVIAALRTLAIKVSISLHVVRLISDFMPSADPSVRPAN